MLADVVDEIPRTLDGEKNYNDHDAHNDALPDVVHMTNTLAVVLDVQSYQRSHVYHVEENTGPIERDKREQELNRSEYGVNSDAAGKSTATEALCLLIVAINAHSRRCCLFLIIMAEQQYTN